MPTQPAPNRQTDSATPKRSLWRMSVSLAAVLVPLLLSGCASTPSSTCTDTRPPGCSPLELLQEAGRICCDASTFEARGTMIVRSPVPKTSEKVRIRWVFGPNGEYRFERGSATIVFDTTYTAWRKPDTGEGNCFKDRTGLLEDARLRHGPHNRYHGDLVMAAGMMAIGMTYPEAAARLTGPTWPDICFEKKAFEFGPDETVDGHLCWKIVGRTPEKEGQFIVWIDKNLRVWRKWWTGAGDEFMSMQYYLFRINQKLKGDEFSISRQERKEADERKY